MPNLDTLPWVPCNHRSRRSGGIDLIVVHTNEGPEGPTSAEGLASYLHRPGVDPGYHVVVDENSAVRCAQDNEYMWAAGGVNSRSWNICVTGYAAQSAAQWHDAASHSAGVILADLVGQAARRFGVPVVKVHDTRPGAPKGICGHADVSAFHPESMGHTDPGPNFPWPEFLAAVGGVQAPPAPIQRSKRVTEFFYRNPHNGNIYLVSGTTRIHLVPGNQALYIWAAAHESPPRAIVDLGNLNDAQLAAMERVQLVGAA